MHRLGSLTIARARLIFLFVFTLASVCGVAAQSSDAEAPTPLTSEEVTGRIAPRDVGDPRRTAYFYLFKGTPGDIALNVESRNLDGDIELYLADGLRPLTQIVLIGGDEVSRAAKSVFLRREAALILRVRARSMGDADGTFRIRFSGAFAPADAALIAKYTKTTAPPVVTVGSANGAQRVTATGALIRTPAPSKANGAESNNETTDSNAPTANTAATPTKAARTASENANKQSATASRGATDATIAANSSRDKTSVGSNAAPLPTKKDAKSSPAASASARTAGDAKAQTKANPSNSSTARRSTTNNSASGSSSTDSSTRKTKSPSAAAASSNATNAARTIGAQTARLILEMRDGTRYERMMISIERVTVENGNLLVITKDGQRIRHPLVDVVRMSIEP